MKRVSWLLTLVILVTTSCDSTDHNKVDVVTEPDVVTTKNSVVEPPGVYRIGSEYVRVVEKNYELDSPCPEFELLGSDLQNVLFQLEVCQFNIEGFRSFDAREDFTFVDYSDFKVADARLIYTMDLAIRRGPEIVAKCSVSIEKQKLLQNVCTTSK